MGNEPRLLGRERGAEGRDRGIEARLMHHHDINIPLCQYYMSALRLFSQIKSKKIAALVEYQRFGAVHVLWLTIAEYPAGKTDNVAPHVYDRKHKTASEGVVMPAVFPFADKPRVKQLVLGIAKLLHRFYETVPCVGGVAEAEALCRRGRYLALCHVVKGGSSARAAQAGIEKLCRVAVELQHPAALFRLAVILLLGHGHAHALCQKLDRLGKSEALDLHYEIYHAAALAAAEAVIYLLVGRH